MLRAAQHAGSGVTSAQAAGWGGYAGSLPDPDGYLWAVTSKPTWSLSQAADQALNWSPPTSRCNCVDASPRSTDYYQEND